jgi:hypothetical protein
MLGFSENKLVIKNLGNLAEGEEAPFGSFTVTKSLTFSDKKIFNHIIKLNKLDEKVENHIHLVPVEGQPFMIQSIIEPESKAETKVESEDVFKDESEINKGFEEPVIEAPEVAEKPAPEPVKQKVIKVAKSAPEVKPAPDAKRVMFAIDDTQEESDVENDVDTEEEEW